MNVFEAVKQSVTTRQAAEHYGIHVGRNGMACCPFHNDKTPSMKLDQRYHCFGCGADGDVIDFIDTHPNEDFYVMNGNRALIKREKFERYLDQATAV